MRILLMAFVLLVSSNVAMADEAIDNENSISNLPKDMVDIALVWTEPIKGVARESRTFNPVRTVWNGLLGGTVTAVKKTLGFLIPRKNTSPSSEYTDPKKDKALLNYSF